MQQSMTLAWCSAALPSSPTPAVSGGLASRAEVGGGSCEACAAQRNQGQDSGVPVAKSLVPLSSLYSGFLNHPQQSLPAFHCQGSSRPGQPQYISLCLQKEIWQHTHHILWLIYDHFAVCSISFVCPPAESSCGIGLKCTFEAPSDCDAN